MSKVKVYRIEINHMSTTEQIASEIDRISKEAKCCTSNIEALKKNFELGLINLSSYDTEVTSQRKLLESLNSRKQELADLLIYKYKLQQEIENLSKSLKTNPINYTVPALTTTKPKPIVVPKKRKIDEVIVIDDPPKKVVKTTRVYITEEILHKIIEFCPKAFDIMLVSKVFHRVVMKHFKFNLTFNMQPYITICNKIDIYKPSKIKIAIWKEGYEEMLIKFNCLQEVEIEKIENVKKFCFDKFCNSKIKCILKITLLQYKNALLKFKSKEVFAKYIKIKKLHEMFYDEDYTIKLVDMEYVQYLINEKLLKLVMDDNKRNETVLKRLVNTINPRLIIFTHIMNIKPYLKKDETYKLMSYLLNEKKFIDFELLLKFGFTLNELEKYDFMKEKIYEWLNKNIEILIYLSNKNYNFKDIIVQSRFTIAIYDLYENNKQHFSLALDIFKKKSILQSLTFRKSLYALMFQKPTSCKYFYAEFGLCDLIEARVIENMFRISIDKKYQPGMDMLIDLGVDVALMLNSDTGHIYFAIMLEIGHDILGVSEFMKKNGFNIKSNKAREIIQNTIERHFIKSIEKTSILDSLLE